MTPLKPLSDQKCGRYCRFYSLRPLFSNLIIYRSFIGGSCVITLTVPFIMIMGDFINLIFHRVRFIERGMFREKLNRKSLIIFYWKIK